MASFELSILAADRDFYKGECESLIVPTSEGQLGVLAHRANMVSAIIPGKLTFRVPGEEDQVVAVSSGIIKIEDNNVIVLVDSCERPDEIDAARAQRAADEAREIMLQKRSLAEFRQAEAELSRALTRLKVSRIEGHGKKVE